MIQSIEIRSLVYASLSIIGLVLSLFVLSLVFNKISEQVSKVHQFPGSRLFSSKRIAEILSLILDGFRAASTLVVVYLFLTLIFSFFEYTSSWAPILLNFIKEPVVSILTMVVNFLPNLFFLIVIGFFTKWFLTFIRFLFSGIENGSIKIKSFYPEWATPTYHIARVVVIAFALVMAFPYIPGSESEAFKGISVFIGVLLSFGSTSAISNLIAGVVLTYMRPFKVGDRVKIADTTGDVIEKTFLLTRIRTIKNLDVAIPNSMALSSHIVNYSSTGKDGLILNTSVTIGYSVPGKKVHELLITAALRTSNVSHSPSPFVLNTALNDFFVSYEINAYTNFPNQMAMIYSELHQNIQNCFDEAKVEIMSPHYIAMRDGNLQVNAKI